MAKVGTNKFVANMAGGAGGGLGLGVILRWVFSLYGLDMPDEVAMSFGWLLTTAGGGIAQYLTRENINENALEAKVASLEARLPQ